MEKEIVLKTYTKGYEAEIAKGLLDEKGIDNMISDDDMRPSRMILKDYGNMSSLQAEWQA